MKDGEYEAILAAAISLETTVSVKHIGQHGFSQDKKGAVKMDEMSDLPPWVLNEIRRIATPEVDACIRTARDIAGFTAFPETLRAPFQYFHEFITKPQPQFITDLRANPKHEHWYHRLVNGILGNTQSAFECVYYHYLNVLDMESRLRDRLAQGNYRNVMGSASLLRLP